MRTPPSTSYSGLTVYIDSPSRFDTERLISGTTRTWFEECCIKPLSLESVDVRDLTEIRTPLLPETKYVALLGSKVAGNFIQDPPGYSTIFQSRPAITAFDPQTCNDHRAMSGGDDEDDDTDSAESDRDTKERIPTRRRNYRFWTAWHLQKLLHRPVSPYPKLDYQPYPRLQEVISVLDNTTNEDLYLDIETSRLHRCLSCIGFSTSSIWPRVYVVPVYLFTGDLGYSDFPLLHRALSLALTRNTVVIHNAAFDLTVLHGWYKFLMPSLHGGAVYDTMAANHRCFPEAEKSLAHVISQWTWLPYHKDQNTEALTREQQNQLWLYNAKDVYALKLIKDAQLFHAAQIPGLLPSINQANASIVPYIVTSLTGLRLDQLALSQRSQTLERHKALYTRMAQILSGRPLFNPGSRDQCASYFHDTLHYDIVSRTPTGRPALGTKQLYQLQLKYPNPLIPVIIKYRATAKDLSMLESELFTLP